MTQGPVWGPILRPVSAEETNAFRNLVASVPEYEGNLLWGSFHISPAGHTYWSRAKGPQPRLNLFFTRQRNSGTLRGRGYNLVRVGNTRNLPRDFCHFVLQYYRRHPAQNPIDVYEQVHHLLCGIRHKYYHTSAPVDVQNIFCPLPKPGFITHTELAFLFAWWPYRKSIQKLVDPTVAEIELNILSKFDICDRCTHALLLPGMHEIFGTTNVVITATCLYKPSRANPSKAWRRPSWEQGTLLSRTLQERPLLRAYGRN